MTHMHQAVGRKEMPDYQNIVDAVITSIADDQSIEPQNCTLMTTLSEVGYEDTIEILSLAYLIERRLKLAGISTHKRIEFLLGANDADLLKTETIDKIVKRIYVKIRGWN